MTIEQAAELAPDVFWFQLYRMARNDHALGLDLVRRAEVAGAHVLVLTVDVPVRTTRPREAAVGLGRGPFRPDLPMLVDMLRSPAWLIALIRHGRPKFSNIKSYAPTNASGEEVIRFARNEIGGAFTWDEIARFRDRWRRPMVLKGILHPLDAAKAVAMGIDGIWVSNYGGRQIEALPPPIDVLPAIAAETGSRATLIMDSGIRSGTDVIRAVALGSQATFAGRPSPGPGRARGGRARPCDQSADRRGEIGAGSDRRAFARRRRARSPSGIPALSPFRVPPG